MISIVLFLPDDERDQAIAELWELGTTGITEASNSIRAFFDEENINLKELKTRFARYEPDIEQEEDRDWLAESKDRWQPFPVGERFYLVPEWREDPAPPGRIRLRIYPGMACGTGAHPATKLCLQAMEAHLKAEDSVLDIGTGTGILAQAAYQLGAQRVIACDIDHASTEIARHNGVAADLFTGSARSVRSGSISVTVANLNAETILNLAAEMKRITTRLFILAGFREDEVPRIEEKLGVSNSILVLDGWACTIIAS